MNYIVFDLEWNQPSTKALMITEPIRFCGEIIQIGAVKMNEAFEVVDTLEIMVKPIYYKKMHTKVKQLTGIANKDLGEGIPFTEAFQRFSKFCGDAFCYLTWGSDDIGILKDNMQMHGMSIEGFPPCYNLQRIFGKQIAKVKKQIALEAAIEMLGEPPYHAHNALHDAVSAARVCRHLDLNQEPPTLPNATSKRKRHRRRRARRGKKSEGEAPAVTREKLI